MNFDITVRQIESDAQFDKYLKENSNAVVCAGRWGPMCIPVYKAMEQLEIEAQYKDVAFLVVNFDTMAATRVRTAPQCRAFMGLPFTVYYKDGQIVKATSSIQSKQQLEDNIASYLR